MQTGESGFTELLSICKEDLMKMKREFREEFQNFFQSGIDEFEKTVKLRSHASDLCDLRANSWTAAVLKQQIKLLSNRDLREMTCRQLKEHCAREI